MAIPSGRKALQKKRTHIVGRHPSRLLQFLQQLSGTLSMHKRIAAVDPVWVPKEVV